MPQKAARSKPRLLARSAVRSTLALLRPRQACRPAAPPVSIPCHAGPAGGGADPARPECGGRQAWAGRPLACGAAAGAGGRCSACHRRACGAASRCQGGRGPPGGSGHCGGAAAVGGRHGCPREGRGRGRSRRSRQGKQGRRPGGGGGGRAGCQARGRAGCQARGGWGAAQLRRPFGQDQGKLLLRCAVLCRVWLGSRSALQGLRLR